LITDEKATTNQKDVDKCKEESEGMYEPSSTREENGFEQVRDTIKHLIFYIVLCP
jgi:hypothetical protein